jgi:hypothetical protein
MDIIDYKMNPLWLDSLKDKSQLNDLFSKIGRLLYVCQRFETNCKRVATYIHITTTADLFSNVDSYTIFLNKIKTSTLNNNIKLFEKLSLIGDPIAILTEARLSRNFIAHEVCIGLENKLTTIADHLKFETDIKSHGRTIANGEFVSTWLCATLLKDPMPNFNRVDDTVKWLNNDDDKTNAV